MTLQRRIGLLFAALALLTVLTAAAGSFVLAERNAAMAELSGRIEPARTLLADLQVAVIDQETGHRGYVTSGDKAFLDPYESGIRRGDALLSQLREVLADDEPSLSGMSSVQAALERWRELAAEPEIAAVRAGGAGAGVTEGGAGLDLFNEVRARSQEVRAGLLRQRADADARSRSASQQLAVLLVSNVALSGVFVFASAVLLRRWIMRPLAELADSVRIVARGDLDRSVSVGGPPELVALGRDVEAMRRRIVDDVRGTIAAREAVEQQAPAVASIRDRLAPTAAGPGGIEVAATLLPAEGMLAGDWYDVLALDDQRVGLIVVDVSGHGTAAGVMALQSKGLLAAALRDGLTPGGALAWTAKHLGDTGDSFLTCFVATLDPATGRGRYASAGHPEALVVWESGVRTCGLTGPLLGPMPGEWGTHDLMLNQGDLLVVHTDGLVEARSADGVEFGTERLRDVLTKHRADGAASALAASLEALRDHSPGRFADDVTIVVLRAP